MKPNTVRNIHIAGRERAAAQNLRELERDTLRLHLRDYQREGVPVPDVVREKAIKLGVEVEG